MKSQMLKLTLPSSTLTISVSLLAYAAVLILPLRRPGNEWVRLTHLAQGPVPSKSRAGTGGGSFVSSSWCHLLKYPLSAGWSCDRLDWLGQNPRGPGLAT